MTKPESNGGYKPYQAKKYFGKQTGKYRRNERIRVPQVRCIDAEGKSLGVISTREAIAAAKKVGLDLVEVSPSARPPVCKILDFGKFMYDESKKQKSNKTSTVKVKEIKFKVNIDSHDYETKLKRAEQFLFKGHKLKMTMMFRGRELSQKDRGFDIIKRAIIDLAGIATADVEPKMMGRNIIVTLSPLPEKKRVLKFNTSIDEHEDHEDDSDIEASNE